MFGSVASAALRDVFSGRLVQSSYDSISVWPLSILLYLTPKALNKTGGERFRSNSAVLNSIVIPGNWQIKDEESLLAVVNYPQGAMCASVLCVLLLIISMPMTYLSTST